jgi:hypothetical protein
MARQGVNSFSTDSMVGTCRHWVFQANVQMLRAEKFKQPTGIWMYGKIM